MAANSAKTAAVTPRLGLTKDTIKPTRLPRIANLKETTPRTNKATKY